jgi:hypothetical protein
MSKGEAAKKVCFVIGPIGDAGTDTRRHADWLLEGIIEPVFNTHFQDFIVERSDKISAPGSISSQIIIRLHTAQLVIADMSQANANAFYEMGIRHMKRLPTIHMYSEGQSIPFDVKPYRAIPFKCAEPKDLKTAQAALKAAIEEAIKPGFVVDNPVTQARGVEKLEETATPEQRVFLDQLQEIHRRLEALETQGRTYDPWEKAAAEFEIAEKLFELRKRGDIRVEIIPGASPLTVRAAIQQLYPGASIGSLKSGGLVVSLSKELVAAAVDAVTKLKGVAKVSIVVPK